MREPEDRAQFARSSLHQKAAELVMRSHVTENPATLCRGEGSTVDRGQASRQPHCQCD
ncbi:MAG: hypothetical protein KBE42_09480 [Steroidobacteraceae bacterium]|nr:hypothetical protein [Steroidobacteraceae bacterium]